MGRICSRPSINLTKILNFHSTKCWQHNSTCATFPRWVFQLRTGRPGIGLRRKQHSAHNRLRSQWLQSHESSLQFTVSGSSVTGEFGLSDGGHLPDILDDGHPSIDQLFQNNRRISPLRAWLCTHATDSSLERFLQWQEAGMKDPLIFSSETPMRKFIAYIDPEDKFAIEDKLSQINTLEQCKSIYYYGSE